MKDILDIGHFSERAKIKKEKDRLGDKLAKHILKMWDYDWIFSTRLEKILLTAIILFNMYQFITFIRSLL